MVVVLPHGAKAEGKCIATGLVSKVTTSMSLWVIRSHRSATSKRRVLALGKALCGRLELGLIDDLETVGVVECHLWVRGHLRHDVDATIDDTHGVEPK